MAKFSREQALRERRARKQEKKDGKKQAALAADLTPTDEPLTEPSEVDPPVA